MITQRTLKNSASLAGVGVHSGESVQITLHPAPENTGIIFRRTDSGKMRSVPAKINYVGPTDFCTYLIKDNLRIATVEHVLSALAAFSIDNCFIDLSLAELPILDGSALPYVALIQSMGIAQQKSAKQFIRIKKTVKVNANDKWVKLESCDGFRVDMEIVYQHPVIEKSEQNFSFEFSSEKYVKEIAYARTFGFLKDYDMMREKNLARGASLDNTVVLDENHVVNENGLRDPNEFVKHKILDVIGDLYLLGHNLIGAFSGYKSGHTLNSQLMQKLLSEKDTWEMVTFDDVQKAPRCYRDC